MFDIDQWLNETMTIRDRILDADLTMPRHERLCFLVMANGGFVVRGWGTIDNGGPGGHQRGLEQDDALDLMRIGEFLNGLETAGVDWSAKLRPVFDAYRERFSQRDKTGQPA